MHQDGIWQSQQGTIEENEIFGNTNAGILIQTEGDPRGRNNIIRNGKYGAIWVQQNGKGRIKGNRIFGNAKGNLVVLDGCHPVVGENEIG